MKMKDLCKDLLNRNDWLILDTETTGLDSTAEVCQIGILAPSGEVLLDQLVKPVEPIPPDATRIHGITNEDVTAAPGFGEVASQIEQILFGKTIAIYNAPYDTRILQQSSRIVNPDYARVGSWAYRFNFLDIMEPYAEYWGDWNDYHQSYTWQKLTAACSQQGVSVIDEHSAIGDCKLTLALIQAIASNGRE